MHGAELTVVVMGVALVAGAEMAFAIRSFDDHVRGMPRFAHLGHDRRVQWAAAGKPTRGHPDEATAPASEPSPASCAAHEALEA